MNHFCRIKTALLGLLALTLSFGLGAQTDLAPKWPGSGRYDLKGEVDSTPAVGPNGTIYIGVSYRDLTGRLHAILPNGSEAWTYQTAASIRTAPVVDEAGNIYFCSDDGVIHSRTSDNRFRWDTRQKPRGVIAGSLALSSSGVLYFGDYNRKAYALSTVDGGENWSRELPDWVESVAIGPDGNVYFTTWCTPENRNSVHVFSQSGMPQWSAKTGDNVYAAPAFAADGTVYVACADGNLYAFSPTGTPRWTYSTGAALTVSPVTGPDGTIYVGSNDGYFYAVKTDGNLKWRYPEDPKLKTPVSSAASVRADGSIVFGANDRRLRILQPDGKLKREQVPLTSFFSAGTLVTADGTIYACTWDGFFYAFHGTGGGLSTLASWPTFQRSSNRQGQADPIATGQLFNLAIRAPAGANNSLAIGWAVRGPQPKEVLVRAVGPGLAWFGVPGFLPDPMLSIREPERPAPLSENDDWDSEEPVDRITKAAESVGAFALTRGAKDSTLLLNLAPGNYSAIISGKNGESGIGLIEAYDVTGKDSPTRLVNVSTRGFVGTNARILIPGIVVAEGRMRLLLRAIGPGLTQFGVSGVLQQPTMKLMKFLNGSYTEIGSNSGWSTVANAVELQTAAASVGAFALAPGSADCAMVVTLEPGIYSVLVSGIGDTTGEALFEAYALP